MNPTPREGSVAWLLYGLPAEEAQAFDLYVIHETPASEIARCMGIARTSVYRLVRRAAKISHTYDLQKLLDRRLEQWEQRKVIASGEGFDIERED